MTSGSSGDRPGAPVDGPIDLEACVTGLVNVVDKGMTGEVLPYGITPTEFSLLRLCMDGESTATRLAQVLPVDAARISRIVTALVAKGLLRRRRLRSDRRIVMLSLSDRGREMTSAAMEKLQGYTARVIEGIAEEELRVFTEVAAHIVANYDAEQDAEQDAGGGG